jgi:hypothetical protein
MAATNSNTSLAEFKLFFRHACHAAASAKQPRHCDGRGGPSVGIGAHAPGRAGPDRRRAAPVAEPVACTEPARAGPARAGLCWAAACLGPRPARRALAGPHGAGVLVDLARQPGPSPNRPQTRASRRPSRARRNRAGAPVHGTPPPYFRSSLSDARGRGIPLPSPSPANPLPPPGPHLMGGGGRAPLPTEADGGPADRPITPVGAVLSAVVLLS